MPPPKTKRKGVFAAAVAATDLKQRVDNVMEQILSPAIEEAAAPRPKKIPPGSKARVQIPIIDRANYVAYLRIGMALEQLSYVPLLAQGVDRAALEKVIKDLNKVHEGPYTAIGMDQEHIAGLTNSERFPECRATIDQQRSAARTPTGKP